MGYLTPFSGHVLWKQRPLTTQAPFVRNRLGIAYSPQEGVVFDDLTVLDNLTLHLRKRNLDQYQNYFKAFPRLQERIHQRAGTLSGGEKKILAFTRVLAEQKPLALFDEPTEGVQQENIDLMATLIQES